MDSKKYFITAVTVTAVFLCGLLIGSVFGSSFLRKKIFTGQGGIFFYKPSSYYGDLYRLLNSSDPLERLSAYYSVDPKDSGSAEFFIDRFASEEIHICKITLVWLLGFSQEKEKATAFLKGLNEANQVKDEKIKLEIIRALQRLGAK